MPQRQPSTSTAPLSTSTSETPATPDRALLDTSGVTRHDGGHKAVTGRGSTSTFSDRRGHGLRPPDCARAPRPDAHDAETAYHAGEVSATKQPPTTLRLTVTGGQRSRLQTPYLQVLHGPVENQVRTSSEMATGKSQYVVSRIATTHMVRNTIISLEGLEDVARQINERERKPVMLAEHDHTCPPLGVIIRASVIPIDDGHHALEAVSVLYGEPAEIELPGGDKGLVQWIPEQPYPLTTADFGDSDTAEIQIDPVNFGGYERAQTAINDLSQIDPEAGYAVGTFERRSLIPDPEVIFRLGVALSATWFATRAGKAAADALEPRLKRFIDAICNAVILTARNALPMTRPITYLVKVNGTPNVDLVVRSRDPNTVIKAFTGDFADIARDVAVLRKRFDAEMVQYILNEKGEWEFNFLLTADGKAIGSRVAFDRRTVLLNQMEEAVQKNREAGPNEPMDRSGRSAAS